MNIDDLIEKHAQSVVDDMDIDDLMNAVKDNIIESFKEMINSESMEVVIGQIAEESADETVDEMLQEYHNSQS